MAITFNNTTYPPGFLGIDDGGVPANGTFQVDSPSTYTVRVNGTVNQAGDTVTMTYGADAPAAYANRAVTLTASSLDNSNQILFTSTSIPPGEVDAGTYRYLLSNTQVYGSPPPAGQTRTRFTADTDNSLNSYNVAAVPCFASGTLILTDRGEVAVEELAVGDTVVTASGAHRPIVWIGQRSIDCTRHRIPDAIWPVRVLAGAFGEDLPRRDLWLSPDHAVRVSVLDEVLIPVKHLVNDATITQVKSETVTYWHVELDAHDILVAEGLPTESFLDTGVRNGFENAGAFMALHPDFSPLSMDGFCLPLVQEGPIVDAVRVRLLARAAALGWTLTDTDDLHVMADGVAIQPERDGAVARFAIPAGTVEARLVSRSFVPERVRVGAGDGRRLGLPLRGLSAVDGAGVVRSLPIDHALLTDGYSFVQTAEGDAWRWTDGNATLPAALWAGTTEAVTLSVEIAADRGTLLAWQAPSTVDATAGAVDASADTERAA
ncbi:Hint domain-containing protein [Methylobacterium sp. J-078]|uniref:Hint domain-containing protein n=1 Tax=Methylobacterium sp. J-078 TaxID=2836657 RepID=UPI001FBA1CD3|nr:Hint domain-containing protein [Methylobacterium sp. J-078]MCJ2044243.1 Hint domain-containing protein [Methylobacterium sp. J-078]